MLLILANTGDQEAARIQSQWSMSQPCSIITPRDLSTSGWRLNVSNQPAAAPCVAQHIARMDDVRGIFTRMACVFEQELLHIVADDRAYVAAEMTSFLTAFLSAVPCRVLNRPSASSLWGEYWNRERWIYEVVRLGIPVATYCRTLPPSPAATAAVNHEVTVTVVGTECVDTTDPALVSYAVQIAQRVNANFLKLQFACTDNNYQFVSASTSPYELPDPVISAMLAYFTDEPAAVN